MNKYRKGMKMKIPLTSKKLIINEMNCKYLINNKIFLFINKK